MSETRPWDMAVVGGGPAGSVLAARLAEGGARVAVFDYRHPWRKPCSGFLTRAVFDHFPPLAAFPLHRPFEGDRRYTSPSGHSFVIPSRHALTQFHLSDREAFDRFLLDRAVSSGAVRIREKVTDVRRASAGWEIECGEKSWRARALAGADGAASLVRRRLVGAISQNDLIVGVGRIHYGRETNELHTVFLPSGGVGFVLPGYGYTQAVIGMRLSTARRRGRLDILYRDYCGSLNLAWDEPGCRWAALQPAPISRGFYRSPCAGDDFCLVGDAAGHCDSLNGEGIPFAIQGATQAAEAFLEDRLRGYDARWRDLYGRRLEESSARASRAPSAKWSKDLIGWALSRSPTLVDSAAQGYKKTGSPAGAAKSSLPRLPKIVFEIVRGRGVAI